MRYLHSLIDSVHPALSDYLSTMGRSALGRSCGKTANIRTALHQRQEE